MNEEYDRYITNAIRDLIQAVDEAALAHFQHTGHLLQYVFHGWECTECEAAFIGELKVVGA